MFAAFRDALNDALAAIEHCVDIASQEHQRMFEATVQDRQRHCFLASTID